MTLKSQKAKQWEEFTNLKSQTNNSSNVSILNRYVAPFYLGNNKKPEFYKESDLIEYLATLNKDLSIGSMNGIKSKIKEFIKWNWEDYPKRFRHLDKICRQQQKEKKYKPSDMLSKRDIEIIVQHETTFYWKAYWLLLFFGGFRPIELCSLKWDQITFDDEGAYIEIFSKKNHKNFIKFIPQHVVFYLKKLQNNNSIYVFPTKRANKHGVPVGDKHLTRSGVWQRLAKTSKEALGKHINPYVLRHSIATILYNQEGIKDHDAAQQLGHTKDMKTTYNNLDKHKIKLRAKRIFIQAEELPPKQKLELEKRINTLEGTIKQLKPLVLELQGLIQNTTHEQNYILNELNKEKRNVFTPIG